MRLSSPLNDLQPRYDFVVVGSGYGGGIAAARLAAAGQRVCVLERGRELQPGDYPSDPLSLAREIQLQAGAVRLGPERALFDLRVYDGINVAVGCALGGTSLINAGLALRPDPRVFASARWPTALQDPAALIPYFARAEEMLRPAAWSDSSPPLAKLRALQRCADRMQLPFGRPPTLINFAALPNGVNHVGVPQNPCVACGDCITGCNHAAKNTVLMNYLPYARAHGAQIFTSARAKTVLPGEHGWRVRIETDVADEQEIEAGGVVLAAGTLGSTEILLRSRAAGLRTSAALGQRFSGNGDMVALSYNCDVPVNAVGFGDLDPAGLEPVGPCSTGMIDARSGRPVDEGMIMVDGAAPGAFAAWLPGVLAALAAATGEDTDAGLADTIRERARELESKLAGPRTGATYRTQICLVVSHDDAAGQIVLDGDRLDIRWPGVGRQAPLVSADAIMRRATQALGGTYIPNPTWHELLGRKLLTGHPLGGCAAADDARDGVVNHRGEVFSGESGTDVHPGLYAMDGSIVPGSLGVNPLLTISALAERCCEMLTADLGS